MLALLSLLPACLASADPWLPTPHPLVSDHRDNPLLRPTELAEWILGDPTVIQLGAEVHRVCNEVFHGILHFTAPADAPFKFDKHGVAIARPGAVRPYVMAVGDTLYLYYEQYQLPSFHTSVLMLRTAQVSISGSGVASLGWEADSLVMLRPELSWEMVGDARVGNPFVFYSPASSEYRMYYSAASVHLADSNIAEPLHLGLAAAAAPSGPWTRLAADPVPVLGSGLPGLQILGIGSLKLVKAWGDSSTDGGRLYALCNRVTLDPATNVTGSTISLVASSTDGLSWEVVSGALIAPATTDPASWKHAYVYGYDTIPDPTSGEHFLAYYNGRDGWRVAREAIGVSRLHKDLLAPQRREYML
jgi:hypothetical protein